MCGHEREVATRGHTGGGEAVHRLLSCRVRLVRASDSAVIEQDVIEFGRIAAELVAPKRDALPPTRAPQSTRRAQPTE
eukprot:SAG11_NODE_3264_length_2570_cov_1.938486_2_plen_78_part_00